MTEDTGKLILEFALDHAYTLLNEVVGKHGNQLPKDIQVRIKKMLPPRFEFSFSAGRVDLKCGTISEHTAKQVFGALWDMGMKDREAKLEDAEKVE